MAEFIIADPAESSALIGAPVIVSFETGVPGPVGPPGVDGIQGPPGVNGAGYTHTQNLVSGMWLIGHGLGYAPSVTVFDDSGMLLETCVHNVDDNNTIVTLQPPSSGYARLN